MENPYSGLSRRPFMACMKPLEHVVTYCHYGRLYPKPTSIWTNVPVVLPRCTPKHPCRLVRSLGYHPATSQNGPPGKKARSAKYPLARMLGTPREIAYEIPDGLVRALFDPFLIGGCPESYPPPESFSNEPEEGELASQPIEIGLPIPIPAP
jgi:hypothetical protein